MTRGRRVFATLLLAGAAAAAPDDLEVALAVSRTSARAAERVARSVVDVRVAGGPAASGVVVSDDGDVLTALHVVGDAAWVFVSPADGPERRARVHARDEWTDLALLRLEEPVPDLVPATWGGSVAPGEFVLAMGSPFGLRGSVSRGVVAAVGRRHVVGDNLAPLIQTDAALNPGSSGGPLFDLRGEVVGLVVAILTRSGADAGVGFAVPAGEIRRLLPALRRGGRVERPWLGLHVPAGDPPPGEEEGVPVLAVVPGGPAHRAGIRRGDRVLSVAGGRVSEPSELRRRLLEVEPGARLRVSVAREGGGETVELVVGSRPREKKSPKDS